MGKSLNSGAQQPCRNLRIKRDPEFRHSTKNRPLKKIPHENCTAGISVTSGRRSRQCNSFDFLRCGFSKVSSRHFDQNTNSHTVKLHLFGFLSNVRIQICPQLWLAGQNENFIYLTFVVGVHIKQQVLRPIPIHWLLGNIKHYVLSSHEIP